MRRTIARDSRDVSIREGLEGLTPARISTLYRRAPLQRPVAEPEDIWKMFKNAGLVLSAWDQQHLVGIVRVLTDGVLYSLICDLAVEPDAQGMGISKRLITAVFERCKGTAIFVRFAAAHYYAGMGFSRIEDAWVAHPV